jgi:hypothetical protein
VAAAALAGEIVDVRPLVAGRPARDRRPS